MSGPSREARRMAEWRAAYPSPASRATLVGEFVVANLIFFAAGVRIAPLLEDALRLPIRLDRPRRFRAARSRVPGPVPSHEHPEVARRVDEGQGAGSGL